MVRVPAFSLVVLLLSGPSFGAPIFQLSLNNAQSAGAIGDPANTSGSFSLSTAGTGLLGSIDWSGTASPVIPFTFGDELQVQITHVPTLTSANIQLGSGAVFPNNTPFSGSSGAFAGTPIAAGDTFSYEFNEILDDGPGPDAIWNAISINFNDTGDTWVEQGDAGQTVPTAQEPQGSGPLNMIQGQIGFPGDADLYQIFINDPAIFSATTVGTPGTLDDTQLFLFDADGNGVYANDDDLFGAPRSQLPAGEPNSPTSPGIYYLGISTFNNDPIDSLSNLIFPSFPFADVVGPNSGVGPLSDFNGLSLDVGTYKINLTGGVYPQQAPEPTAIALWVLVGSVLLGYGARRRKPADK